MPPKEQSELDDDMAPIARQMFVDILLPEFTKSLKKEVSWWYNERSMVAVNSPRLCVVSLRFYKGSLGCGVLSDSLLV